MYFCQPTGKGSLDFEQLRAPSDFTLNFIGGYYYLPQWAKSLSDNLPDTKGDVKIINVNQHNFIVSKAIYDSVRCHLYNDDNKPDKFVVNKFTSGCFSVERKIEPTKFDNSVLPYTEPWWSGQIFSTKDSMHYFGIVKYRMKMNGCSSSKDFFSILNTKENSIKHWFPQKNARLSHCRNIYVDSYNGVIYLIADNFNFNLSDCENNAPFKYSAYRSDDEGKTWREDTSFQSLLGEDKFLDVEFLDKEHVMCYSVEKLGGVRKRVYYVMKNMQVIDSLKIPDDIYYSRDYLSQYTEKFSPAHYEFPLKRDTVFLGRGGSEAFPNYGSLCLQFFLARVNDKWKFQAEKSVYYPPISEENNQKEYRNFHLVNNRELVFKNGSGSLTLKADVVSKTNDDSGGGYRVLEKGNQIYLISIKPHYDDIFFIEPYCGHIFISFNGGTSWYVYPGLFDYVEQYYLLSEIDEQGIITHFTRGGIMNDNTSIYKVSHKFHFYKSTATNSR